MVLKGDLHLADYEGLREPMTPFNNLLRDCGVCRCLPTRPGPVGLCDTHNLSCATIHDAICTIEVGRPDPGCDGPVEDHLRSPVISQGWALCHNPRGP